MHLRPSAPLLLAAALLAACGGSGGGSAVDDHRAVARGPIEAFSGALTVGGVRFDVRDATLRLLDDGQSITLASNADAPTHLRRGMVVVVKGTIADDGATGTATEILYRSVLRGTVQGIGDGLLAIAGADVVVDADTVLLDAAGAPLAYEAFGGGDLVEVSGHAETGTRVRATLVRRREDAGLRVRGWTLGALVDGAFQLSLLPEGAPLVAVDARGAAVGTPVPADALVEVTGSALAAAGPPVLTATAVRVEAQLGGLPQDRGEVAGVVSTGAPADFQLDDVRVVTSAATRWTGLPAGATPAQELARGVKVLAGGHFTGPTTLVADRVALEPAARLEGRIVPGSFVLGNPASIAAFTVGTTSVLVDSGTRIEAASGLPLSPTQLAQLHAVEPGGLPVVVRGHARAGETFYATRVTVP